jgi:hypothetical protein
MGIYKRVPQKLQLRDYHIGGLMGDIATAK